MTAQIEILPYDIRPSGPLFFNVRNKSGANAFMAKISKWSDGRADGTSYGYVFKHERLGRFLAFAEACGVEVIRH